MLRACLKVAVLLIAAPCLCAENSEPFPHPPELAPNVRFWTRVYTEVDTNAGFVHDSRHLDVVYETLRFPEGSSRRTRKRIVQRTKRRYETILRALGRGKRDGLDDDERRVLALWPENVRNADLRAATHHVRFQLGQADKFLAGWIRSGAWEQHIYATLERMGLPKGLVALPHVESSFNPRAYSRVGAAGMWQFTRATGRRYMRIDNVVDERLDPYTSTVAAARLLKHNLAVTGTWPLAITAYNHGASGARRAARKLGTTDIATIVRKYRSRRFGFASRNFYVAFLAALDVHSGAEKYFGEVARHDPQPLRTVKVPDYLHVDTVERALGVDLATLRRHNPALRPSVWRGSKYVPRDFALRLPGGVSRERAERMLASVAESQRFAAQTRDRFYKVRRGDTLDRIARRYDADIDEMVALNGLRNRHRIRAGQVLRLPLGDEGEAPTRVASKAEPATPPSETAPEPAAPKAEPATPPSETAPEPAAPEGPPPARAEASKSALSLATLEAAVARREPAVVAASGETDAVTPAPGAEAPAELAADPSDYSVADNGTIEVQAAETLGHYAEWLELRAARLRQVNGLRFGRPVVIGQRLRLDLSRVDAATFERRRLAYHRTLQEDFFLQFQIAGTLTHVVRAGDSLWLLTNRRYEVPIWLVRQYNPDLDFDDVVPGTTVTIPIVESRARVEPAHERAG